MYGQRYSIKFFYAQRQTMSADFRMRTNIFDTWQNDEYAVSLGFD